MYKNNVLSNYAPSMPSHATATEASKMRPGLEAELQRAHADLEKANARVRETIARTKRLADSCLGAIAENSVPAAAANFHVSGGFCGALIGEIASVNHNLAELEETLNRLGV